MAESKHNRIRLGLTLTEVVMSTAIVGVMSVAALNTLGAATRSSMDNSDRGIATSLAGDLMAEILNKHYQDPVGSATFGIESAETASGRLAFDDVDDYDAWISQPPVFVDGTPIPDRDAWKRYVDVRHVDPNDLNSVLSDTNDQGVKRIEVFVYHDGQQVHTLTAYTTQSWSDVFLDGS